MRTYLTIAAGITLLAACTAGDDDAATDTATTDSPAAAAAPDPSVTAMMRDASGRDLGTLTLTDAGGGISVSGTLRGLPPGDHGMHIHMVGRCDPPTFESAGEHWNPTTRQHGTENPQGPHLGDLPNVTVGTDSTATVQGTTTGGSLRGTTNMLLDADGGAVIIHTSRDDLKTDPSGGSGAPIACGAVSGQ
jgi:superoxide dismutase, Cu-Zn family